MISPVLRPHPLGDTDFQSQASRDPYRLHPPRPEGWLTSQGGGTVATEAQPVGSFPGYVTPRPSQSSPLPPNATCPQFSKGAAPWSADKGPWSVAGSGVPAWGPGPRATLAAQLRQYGGWGGHEQSPGGTGGPRKEARSGGGAWHKSFGTSAEEPWFISFPRDGGFLEDSRR